MIDFKFKIFAVAIIKLSIFLMDFKIEWQLKCIQINFQLEARDHNQTITYICFKWIPD